MQVCHELTDNDAVDKCLVKCLPPWITTPRQSRDTGAGFRVWGTIVFTPCSCWLCFFQAALGFLEAGLKRGAKPECLLRAALQELHAALPTHRLDESADHGAVIDLKPLEKPGEAQTEGNRGDMEGGGLHLPSSTPHTRGIFDSCSRPNKANAVAFDILAAVQQPHASMSSGSPEVVGFQEGGQSADNVPVGYAMTPQPTSQRHRNLGTPQRVKTPASKGIRELRALGTGLSLVLPNCLCHSRAKLHYQASTSALLSWKAFGPS